MMMNTGVMKKCYKKIKIIKKYSENAEKISEN